MDEPEANPYVRDPPLEFDPVEALDEETVDAQVDHLRAAIRYHDHCYYQEADPVVPDRTYDRLFDRLETLEDAFDLDSATSPTRRVGGEPLDELETFEHVTQMLSIDSAVEEREVRSSTGACATASRTPATTAPSSTSVNRSSTASPSNSSTRTANSSGPRPAGMGRKATT